MDGATGISRQGRISNDTTQRRRLDAKENVMNRLVLVMWVLVSVGGAMSISAAADDHGKHPKQGKCIAKAMTHL